jgi:hypothetical protein
MVRRLRHLLHARLSQALIVSGTRMHRTEIVGAGLRSLDWLVSFQVSHDGDFAPIGCNGFLARGSAPAAFDQQPVEACTVTSACLAAYGITGDARWMERASRAFEWFLGRNSLQHWLYDTSTGGCCDGLHADRTNRNQGAESTLSFLLALSEMRAVHPTVIQPGRAVGLPLTT